MYNYDLILPQVQFPANFGNGYIRDSRYSAWSSLGSLQSVFIRDGAYVIDIRSYRHIDSRINQERECSEGGQRPYGNHDRPIL